MISSISLRVRFDLEKVKIPLYNIFIFQNLKPEKSDISLKKKEKNKKVCRLEIGLPYDFKRVEGMAIDKETGKKIIFSKKIFF